MSDDWLGEFSCGTKKKKTSGCTKKGSTAKKCGQEYECAKRGKKRSTKSKKCGEARNKNKNTKRKKKRRTTHDEKQCRPDGGRAESGSGCGSAGGSGCGTAGAPDGAGNANSCRFAGASATTARDGPTLSGSGEIPFSVPQLVTCVATVDGKVWTVLQPGEYRYDFDVYFRAPPRRVVIIALTVDGVVVPGSEVRDVIPAPIIVNAERFGRLCLRCGQRVAVTYSVSGGGTLTIESEPPVGSQVSLFNLQQVSACT